MKNLLLMILSLSFLSSLCAQNDSTEVSKELIKSVLEPSISYLNFPVKGESPQILKVKSNQNWRAYRSEGWVIMDKRSGNLNDSISVALKKNPFSKGRSAKIRLKAKGIEKTVILNQASAEPMLSISKADIIATEKDNTVLLDITSNTAWCIKSSENWLQPQEESGINDYTVVLNVDDNLTGEKRTAVVTISSIGLEDKVFKVVQSE